MLPRGLLKEYFRVLSLILRVLDVSAIVVAGLAAYYYKFGNLHLTHRYILALCIAALLILVVFPFFQIYSSVRAKGFWQPIQNLIKAVGMVLILLSSFAFLTKTGEDYSRSWYILWASFSLVLFVISRCLMLLFLHLMRAHGLNERRVIIMGAGPLGKNLAETVQEKLWTGFKIVAFFDDNVANKPAQMFGIPILQTPNDMSAYLNEAKESIDELWIALPMGAESRVKHLLHELRHHTISIRFILDIFGFDLLNHSIMDLAGFPTLCLNASPMIGMNRFIKAIEDRIIATAIILFISPLLLLIALAIKLTSPGPVLFKQHRHGWDGKIIKVYKFRTMHLHNESGRVTQARSNDERITPLGRWLRKTSLDELPQFLNVLQGRMSIVGPRPHAVVHNEFYKESIKAYMQRHRVKPGITGWAQINGWRGETETLEKMQKRVEYDLYYIQHWSLWFDLKIILLTLFKGFIHKNAY